MTDGSGFWLQIATLVVGAIVTLVSTWLALKFKTAADDAKAAKTAAVETRDLAARAVAVTSQVSAKTDALEIKVDGRLTQLIQALDDKARAEKSEATVIAHGEGVRDQKERERLRAEGAAHEKETPA